MRERMLRYLQVLHAELASSVGNPDGILLRIDSTINSLRNKALSSFEAWAFENFVREKYFH